MKKEEMAAIEAEGIIKREKVMWYKKKLMAFSGELILTKQKIHFIQDGNPLAGPLLKLIIKKQGQHEAWSAPVSAVTDVTHESLGLAKNIASIKHGSEFHNVMVKDVAAWKDAIITAR